MKGSSSCLAALMQLLFCVVGFAQAPAFRITGIVVDSNSGSPVAQCHLEASLNAARRGPGPSPGGLGPGLSGPGGFAGPARRMGFGALASIAAETDEHGRFALSVPSAGAWHLTASAAGYVTQAYAAHGIYSSAIVLTDKNPSYDLRFQLPSEGRIAGTITDEAGEAVRNASVSLYVQPISGLSGQTNQFQTRGFAQTDDRGSYEFDALPPGTYRVMVSARPWYASTSQRSGTATADPSLDLSYAPAWFPGVGDSTQAEPIQLGPGDSHTADFQLTPIPSLHLIIIPPQTTSPIPGRPTIPVYPVIEPIDSIGAGRMGQAQSSVRRPDGSIDIGGLTPGTYRVMVQGQQQASTVVQVSSGAVRTLDLRQTDAELAKVSFHFEGEDGDPMMVELIDPTNGHRYSPDGRMRSGFGPGRSFDGPDPPDRGIEMQVPPGRYEVFVQGRRGNFLTGITAQGAEVEGRYLNLRAGEASVTLHTAEGRVTVTGTATINGKPSVGAVVLLVPAGLGDPHALTMAARDQTNTDGSFELPSVIPGQYILIAVDHGWQINWDDLSTLRNYLIHGVPLDLSRTTKLNQEIAAQTP